MSKTKKEKTDKKIFIKWILAFLVGVVGGFFSRPVLEWFKIATSGIEFNMEFLMYLATALFLLVNMVGVGISYVFYKKAKKMTEDWDEDNEDVLDDIENKLDIAMLPIAIMTSVNYFLFGLTTYIGLVLMKGQGQLRAFVSLMDIAIFVVALFTFVALQKKCIDLTKQLNPEKKGNVFDKNFSKEWLASCDEAQQLMIYKASYAAYKSAGGVCQILWLVTIIGMMSFNTGLLPVFCVSTIMLVMQIAYFMEAKKMERGKK